jgi:hypothetical protein
MLTTVFQLDVVAVRTGRREDDSFSRSRSFQRPYSPSKSDRYMRIGARRIWRSDYLQSRAALFCNESHRIGCKLRIANSPLDLRMSDSLP